MDIAEFLPLAETIRPGSRSCWLTGSTTVSYSYDGAGRRLMASSGTQASKKTKYLWDQNWPLYQLALERDGQDKLMRRYVHGTDLVSMTTGGSEYYYHHDGLGSVVNVTSSAGASQWSYTYEPYGAMRSETKHANKAPASLMLFTGELFDPNTGLYHFRARQYDPSGGRFLSTDPLAAAISDPYVSTFVYANNRPTVMTDPTGLRGRFGPLFASHDPFSWSLAQCSQQGSGSNGGKLCSFINAIYHIATWWVSQIPPQLPFDASKGQFNPSAQDYQFYCQPPFMYGEACVPTTP